MAETKLGQTPLLHHTWQQTAARVAAVTSLSGGKGVPQAEPGAEPAPYYTAHSLTVPSGQRFQASFIPLRVWGIKDSLATTHTFPLESIMRKL